MGGGRCRFSREYLSQSDVLEEFQKKYERRTDDVYFLYLLLWVALDECECER